MLVKSGIIQGLITFGIDLIMILALEVALPALFAVIVSNPTHTTFRVSTNVRDTAFVTGRGLLHDPVFQPR